MSSVTLYNTLTRKKEEFQSLEEGIARLYLCGPTVYDYAHIGNLRTYVSWDILGRTLRSAGYRIVETMNVTDIEDKIIVNLNGRNLDEFTKQYTDAFVSDLESLNIELPNKYENVQNYKSGLLFATKEIEVMGALIDQIWTNGYAYESEGSIYFDVQKYATEKKYGVLSKVELSKQKSRIDSDEYDREEVQDFALWKAHKEGDPSFEVMVNGKTFKGRPGWHIECTAMSIKNLGQTFDIHTGGVDHIFPHHENEIAQAKAANPEEDFVKYWLHAEFMLVDGKKMSKSLGNIYTLKEVTEKGLDPLDLRFLFLQSHYQSKLNLTWDSLKSARVGRENLLKYVFDLPEPISPAHEWATVYENQFMNAMSDNLDTPRAMAVLSGLVKESNKKNDKQGLLKIISKMDEILQLDLLSLRNRDNKLTSNLNKIVAGGLRSGDFISQDKNPEYLKQKRDEARRLKNWAESDALRRKIEGLGWVVEDTPEGSKLVPKR